MVIIFAGKPRKRPLPGLRQSSEGEHTQTSFNERIKDIKLKEGEKKKYKKAKGYRNKKRKKVFES